MSARLSCFLGGSHLQRCPSNDHLSVAPYETLQYCTTFSSVLKLKGSRCTNSPGRSVLMGFTALLFQKSLKREESGSDDQLAFEEFVHYLQDYEKDLKLVVKSINGKNAGLWLGRGHIVATNLCLCCLTGFYIFILLHLSLRTY